MRGSKKVKAYALGVASSGTRWMNEIVGAHPQVRKTIHESFPTGTAGKMYFPPLPVDSPGWYLFVICRDVSIVKRCWARCNYTLKNSPLFDLTLATNTVKKVFIDWPGPKVK
ncbi:unnamed protein product, partial [marine sediment metagenome]